MDRESISIWPIRRLVAVGMYNVVCERVTIAGREFLAGRVIVRDSHWEATPI